tara:strand:- start:32 stop:472 length:441 start_codon:yes stop_codon:yes gene_type:complete
MKKPKKQQYENQREILEQFKQFILPRLKALKGVKEARVWGSLARDDFGMYKKEYRGQIGSDVDLVILLEQGARICPSWRKLISKTWFDGYYDRFGNKKFRDFYYQGNIHKVDLLVVNRDNLELARQRLKGDSKSVYLKQGEKQELS